MSPVRRKHTTSALKHEAAARVETLAILSFKNKVWSEILMEQTVQHTNNVYIHQLVDKASINYKYVTLAQHHDHNLAQRN